MIEPNFQAQQSKPELERFYGKYAGLVLKNEAPKNDTHGGELLVEISGLLEEDPSARSHAKKSKERPMQVRARPCFMPGFFFIPEVGDQVWIEFVGGDINQPLWTGVWYPKTKTPKTFDEQDTTEFQKVIRTASGNVIQLDDTKDNEQVVIRHKADTVVTIDNDSFNIAHHSGTSLNIDKDGNVAIQHKDGMTIEISNNKINVTADEIVLNGTVNITGETTIRAVENGPNTTISGNEITGKAN